MTWIPSFVVLLSSVGIVHKNATNAVGGHPYGYCWVTWAYGVLAGLFIGSEVL